jgi:predicted solute-binding protein
LLPETPVRVAAVSYLNTVPLIWGLTEGLPNPRIELRLDTPSVCARRIAEGQADVGIVPVAEVWRNHWDTVRGCGIACRGAVRTILLVSRKPWDQVKTLATDSGSRTSVMLSRVILGQRYGAQPVTQPMEPVLGSMLDSADAALVIGDAALRLEPEQIGPQYGAQWLDLGEEWMELTGLPFVFATWSGPRVIQWPWLGDALRESLRSGMANLEGMIERESAARGFEASLVRDYFTRYIQYEIGPAEEEGLARFLQWVGELEQRPALTA